MGSRIRPTQRSVLARQRNNSFDDGWKELSFSRALRITIFQRNAVRAKQMFNPARNMCWFASYNPFMQKTRVFVIFSTLVFAILIISNRCHLFQSVGLLDRHKALFLKTSFCDSARVGSYDDATLSNTFADG